MTEIKLKKKQNELRESNYTDIRWVGSGFFFLLLRDMHIHMNSSNIRKYIYIYGKMEIGLKNKRIITCAKHGDVSNRDFIKSAFSFLVFFCFPEGKVRVL